MKNCIVITRSASEVRQLFAHLGVEFENTDYWGNVRQDHNALWIWRIKDGVYSGSSGYKSLENSMDVHPDYPVMDIKSFLQTPILTP